MLDHPLQHRHKPQKRSAKRGREAIVQSAREHFRACSQLNLSRIEIAAACEVAPALISYHFKDNKSLIEAVTKPLISAYCHKLWDIKAQILDDEASIREIIRLLIVMNADDLFLVDYLLQDVGMHNLDAEDRESLDAFRVTISRLLDSLMASGRWRRADPTQARLSLWGTCRIFGQAVTAESRSSQPGSFDRATAISQHVDHVCAMFADPNPTTEIGGAEREDATTRTMTSPKATSMRSHALAAAG